MKTKIVFITLLMTAFMSCLDNNDIPIDSENLLLGNWINATYENETLSFDRAADLIENEHGVSFKENGVFIERTSGWCGTPPLVFMDIEGKYVVEENIIKVTMDYFSGDFNWKIEKLTNQELVVTRQLTDQEKDHQELMALFEEVQTMADSETCTDASEWDFAAYGSKACGGPKGYIAYSKKIDVELFFQKVQAYTEAEDVYNKKWGIISTCDITPQPTAVVCQNGFPVLIY